jgi:cytochrome c biogenesis protein CcmG/thiol:disulfide interchange protein DsbE
VIDASGRIAYKHIGPVTTEVWETTLAPLVRSLQRGKS